MAQLVAAAVAVGLCWPVAVGTLWMTRRLAARHPLGGVIGMLLGTMIRLVVAVGGGMAVYFLTDAVRGAGLGFWFWLLFAYLAALVAEVVLLVRLTPTRREAPDGKG
jgi:hypothetical protein